MRELPSGVVSLLGQQCGVVTRQQLLHHGVSKEAIRWNSGRSWRVLLPCTYLVDGANPTQLQRLVAAQLHAGPASVLAAATAASAHGLRNADPRGRVRLVVPANQKSRRRGYVDIRSSLLDDSGVVVRGPLRLSSVARSCVDAAVEERSARNRTALLVEAVQRRLTTVDQLAEWCYRLRTRDAAKVLPALETAALGVWSVPEAEVLALMEGSTVLAEVSTNPSLADEHGNALVTPDLWLDDVAMAVMVHSKQYHANGDEFVDTIERDADLVASGVVVVGVTPSGVRRDPAATLQKIEAAYAVAQRRARPAVRATTRTVA